MNALSSLHEAANTARKKNQDDVRKCFPTWKYGKLRKTSGFCHRWVRVPIANCSVESQGPIALMGSMESERHMVSHGAIKSYFLPQSVCTVLIALSFESSRALWLMVVRRR